MRLGIGTYTYAWAIGVPGHPPPQPLSAIGLLEEARRLRVDVVQFCDNLSLADLPPDELKRVEERARALHLVVELGTRGLDPANLREHIRLCSRFGCSFLRVVVDRVGD